MEKNNNFRDYSKKIAIYALEKTKQVKTDMEAVLPDFHSLSKKIPAYIQFNGLAPTIAFLISKLKKSKRENGQENKNSFEEKEHYLALKFMFLWLTNESMYKSHFTDIISSSANDCTNQLNDNCILMFVEAILNLDSNIYRVISSEVIKLFQWLARFTSVGSK